MKLLLSLLCTLLLSSPVYSAEEDNPPAVEPKVELDKYLKDIQRTQRNFEVTDTNPHGRRRGRRGDLVLYNDGSSLRLCRNISLTTGGGVSWSCEAVSTSTQLCFEGVTEDDYETCVVITDPTTDRTVTIPNTSLNFTATEPALVFGTTNAAGDVSTFVRTNATIALFDTTVPAIDGTAATGTAGKAARRDHVHPLSAAWIPVESLTLSGSSTSTSTLPTSSEQFLLVFDQARSTGAVTLTVTGPASPTYTTTTLTGTTLATTTTIALTSGSSTFAGTVLFTRTSDSAANGWPVALNLSAHDSTVAVGLRATIGASTNDAITSVTINGTSLSGKAHLFRLSQD